MMRQEDEIEGRPWLSYEELEGYERRKLFERKEERSARNRLYEEYERIKYEEERVEEKATGDT